VGVAEVVAVWAKIAKSTPNPSFDPKEGNVRNKKKDKTIKKRFIGWGH
jgi:hypothetical protein